jgi:transposase
MARVEVITGPERRRRWGAEQKPAIVAASLAPGAVVTEIARRADICAGQIYRWAPNSSMPVCCYCRWSALST